MKVKSLFTALYVSIALLVTACGGGSSSAPAPTTGTLSGTVTAGNPATALAGVSVTIFDATTNAPAGSTVQTGTNGYYSFTLSPGSYYVKLNKQGYDPIPSPLLTPVPLAVTTGLTTTNNVLMTASAVTGTGWITGSVKVGTAGVAGVLVAAEATTVTVAGIPTAAYTSLTDSNGNYTIYNVPAGTYNMKAYAQGFSAAAATAAVTAAAASTSNLTLTAGAAGTVAANFNLIAATGVVAPATMVTSLVHPVTKETIPGMSLSMPYASAITYNFTSVPDGTYIVRTTFANDTIVVDPDALLKFGEPKVVVTAGVPAPANVGITATSAVQLTGANTNARTSTTPVLVAVNPAPVFTWNAYPQSNSGYGVEVMDASTGTIIWGGVTNTAGVLTFAAPVAAGTTMATYGGPALTAGKTYRWRIYAATAATGGAAGLKLLSMSEDQVGLFVAQ